MKTNNPTPRDVNLLIFRITDDEPDNSLHMVFVAPDGSLIGNETIAFEVFPDCPYIGVGLNYVILAHYDHETESSRELTRAEFNCTILEIMDAGHFDDLMFDVINHFKDNGTDDQVHPFLIENEAANDMYIEPPEVLH